MADSERTTTLPVSRRRLLAGAGVAAMGISVTVTETSRAALPASADAQLFDLIRQFHEATKAAEQAGEEAHALYELVSSRVWTAEEMATHRIRLREGDSPFLSLKDLERIDGRDDPRSPTTMCQKREDGRTWTQTITIRYPTPAEATEEEIAAWRERCAARRALYDAKLAEHKEAERTLGINAADDRVDMMWGEAYRLAGLIEATAPVTVAGVLAKLKTCKAACPDEDIAESGMFLAVLSDLERLSGGAA